MGVQTSTHTHIYIWYIVSSGEMVDLIFPDHVIAYIPYLQEIGKMLGYAIAIANVSARVSFLRFVLLVAIVSDCVCI